MVEPRIQWFGSGLGQSGSTSNRGAWTAPLLCAAALRSSTACEAPSATRRATTLAPRTRTRFPASCFIFTPSSLPADAQRAKAGGRKIGTSRAGTQAQTTSRGATENTEFEPVFSVSSCLRGVVETTRALFAGFGDALERGSVQLPVLEHARDADALADVAAKVQAVPRVRQLDGLRALLDEAGLPAAPLRRVLALRVLQPERLIVLHEAADDGDRFEVLPGLRGLAGLRLRGGRGGSLRRSRRNRG